MRCHSFQVFKETDLLTREYGLAARLHILVPGDIDSRRFFFLCEMLEKDILEEQNPKKNKRTKGKL